MSNPFGYINGLTLNLLLRRHSKGESPQEANWTAKEPLLAFVPIFFFFGSPVLPCPRFVFFLSVLIRLLNCYDCRCNKSYNSIFFISVIDTGSIQDGYFMNKTTSGRRYLHIQPSENDVDGEETKSPIFNPITSLCKSDCARGPPSLPWWSTENLKTAKCLCSLLTLK